MTCFSSVGDMHARFRLVGDVIVVEGLMGCDKATIGSVKQPRIVRIYVRSSWICYYLSMSIC